MNHLPAIFSALFVTLILTGCPPSKSLPDPPALVPQPKAGLTLPASM